MVSSEVSINEIFENPKSIFSTLTPMEKVALEKNITLTYFKKNEYIFTEGENPTSFLFLKEGKAIIFKEGFGGREQILQMVKPLGIVGYRALLADEPYIASAVTLEESTVCSVSRDYLYNKLLKNPAFSLRLLQIISKELGFSNLRTVNLTQKHTRGRLAESLLLLKEKYGWENDGATLKVYLSRIDLAHLSNMTHSNAIRTLTSFAEEKVIALDGRKIRILDLQKLERISKLG